MTGRFEHKKESQSPGSLKVYSLLTQKASKASRSIL